MKKEMCEIVICCEECGKEPTADETRSNANWTVYNAKEPCECGGKLGIFTQDERNEIIKKAKLKAIQN